MLISALMIEELNDEFAMTRRLLARIPDAKLTWQPSDKVNSIGWNASHLAEIAGWTPGILSERELDMAPVDGPAYVIPEVTSTSQLLTIFDGNVAQTLAALAGVPDSVMDEPWTLKMGGHEIFTMPKGACIRKWVFGHSAHHRGILSAYMHLAGVEFPSIYEE